MAALGSIWADGLATAGVVLALAVSAAAQEPPKPLNGLAQFCEEEAPPPPFGKRLQGNGGAPEIVQARLEAPKLREAAGHWFQAAIVSGRVAVTGRRFGSTISKSTGGSQRENLTIRVAGGAPVINYRLSTSREELTIDVTGGNRVSILLAAKGDSSLVPVRFDQPAKGPLSLSVGGEGDERVYRAASLWHLFIAEPEVCGRHLAPVLQLLDGNWDPAEMAADVESALVEGATASRQPDRRRWATLVEQLGDDRFARREEADRQLRREGRLVVAYLQRLDPGQLDAEQQYRIRRIVRDLSDRSAADTPEQVAACLAGDPVIWLALLRRDELSTRRLAAEQLEAVLGQPVAFDPAADPATRRRQLDALRTLITDQ